FGKHRDVLPVSLEMAVGDIDPAAEAAMHAVEFEEMGVHLGRAEIVDRNEVEVLAAGFKESPERKPADPAKSVYGDALNCHVLPYAPPYQSTHGPRQQRPQPSCRNAYKGLQPPQKHRIPACRRRRRQARAISTTRTRRLPRLRPAGQCREPHSDKPHLGPRA